MSFHGYYRIAPIREDGNEGEITEISDREGVEEAMAIAANPENWEGEEAVTVTHIVFDDDYDGKGGNDIVSENTIAFFGTPEAWAKRKDWNVMAADIRPFAPKKDNA